MYSAVATAEELESPAERFSAAGEVAVFGAHRRTGYRSAAAGGNLCRHWPASLPQRRSGGDLPVQRRRRVVARRVDWTASRSGSGQRSGDPARPKPSVAGGHRRGPVPQRRRRGHVEAVAKWPAARHVQSLAFASSSPNVVYASLCTTAQDKQPFNGGVYSSNDAGQHWQSASGEGLSHRVGKRGNRSR